MKRTVYVILITSLISLYSFAESSSNQQANTTNDSSDTYILGTRRFGTKAEAIRYLVTLGKPMSVTHSRCEILTNKLTFKACPKNRVAAFDNEQFKSLSQTK